MTYCCSGKLNWNHFPWENTALAKWIFFRNQRSFQESACNIFSWHKSLLKLPPFFDFQEKKKLISFSITSSIFLNFSYYFSIANAKYVICYKIHFFQGVKKITVVVCSRLVQFYKFGVFTGSLKPSHNYRCQSTAFLLTFPVKFCWCKSFSCHLACHL